MANGSWLRGEQTGLADLTPIELQVYLIYLGHMDQKTGYAWPGATSIAKKIGHKTPRKVYPARQSLVQKGYLRVFQQGGVKGTNHDPNVYEVLIPPFPGSLSPANSDRGRGAISDTDPLSEMDRVNIPLNSPLEVKKESATKKKRGMRLVV